MGGKKSQTVGYKYFASLAMVIGNRIEELVGINFDKRGFITGIKNDLGLDGVNHFINEPNLYGEEEGGVLGNLRVHLGQNEQTVDAHYQAYFPKVSAYPYQSYLVFNDFYFGNSGFLKEMMLMPKRIHVKSDGSKQWYDEKAEIGTIYYKADGNYTADPVADFIRNNPNSPFVKPVLTNIIGTENWSIDGDDIKYKYLYIYSNTPTPEESSVKGESVFDVCRRSIDEFEKINNYGYKYYSASENPLTCKFEYYYGIGNFTIHRSVNNNAKEESVNIDYISRLITDSDDAASQMLVDVAKQDFEYSEADINPIHKIREILTDDTAMNKPLSDINEQNFIDAADRIFKDELGISWAITEKSCKEALDEICDHIEGGIRVNRQTGQYEVILFRDDLYDINAAQSFNESNIKSLNLDIANSDEIINTLNVKYYDRQSIKESSFNISDIGLIRTTGQENAESIEFPYFMNRRNAEIVANWKLKQLSTPAWSGSFSTGSYEARSINRYDVIKLSWVSKNIVDMPVRVLKINLGDGINNTVEIEFVEVVPYSQNITANIAGNPPPPIPLAPQKNQSVLFEMPYLEAVQQFSQFDTDNRLNNDNNLSFLMVATKRPQDNSINALLFTDYGNGYQRVAAVDYCATAELVQNIDYTQESFLIKNPMQLNSVIPDSLFFIDNEVMAFVSYDENTSTITVKRGVLDTLPQLHDADATLYFYDDYASYDLTQYTLNETVDAKVLTTTPNGVQSLDDADALQLTMQARAIRPYPPANILINREYKPSEIYTDLTITWVDRNRLQQTGSIQLGFFDGGVTIEQGTTTELTLIQYDVNMNQLDSLNLNVTALNTYSLPITLMQAETKFIQIELKTVRDNYDCLQPFVHTFEINK